MFKRCLIFVLIVLSGVCCAWGQWVEYEECLNINSDKQTWESEHKVVSLWGDVYVARPGEPVDFEVKISGKDDWADLKIVVVNKPGHVYPKQWRFVNDRKKADFSIRFVKSDAHFAVRFISMKEWEEWWNGVLSWP